MIFSAKYNALWTFCELNIKSNSRFSNFGFTSTDICAIGENIPGLVLNNQIAYLSGTSQSTAYVSAIASIIGSYMPEFNPVEVKKIILNGAKSSIKLTNYVLTEAIVDLNGSLSLLTEGDNIIINNNFFENNKFENYSVFPNPFFDNIIIQLETNKNENLSLELYDISGKLIRSKSVVLQKGYNEIEIDNLFSLEKGIYLLKSKNIFKKLLKIY